MLLVCYSEERVITYSSNMLTMCYWCVTVRRGVITTLEAADYVLLVCYSEERVITYYRKLLTMCYWCVTVRRG